MSDTPNIGLHKPDIGSTNWGGDVNANWDTLDANLPKSNFSASAAPTANDDSGDGYAVGSRWFDTTNDKAYVCLDASLGAAVWKETTSTGTITDVTASSPLQATGTSTKNISFADQSANTILAGPPSGGAVAPTFRSMVTNDLPDNGVTDAKLRDSSATSVIGRSAGSSGDPADITASADDQVLRRSGGALGFGTIGSGSISDNAITDAKLRDSVATSIIGRSSNSSGDPADIQAAANDRVLARASDSLSFQQVSTNMIADGAVSNAKQANMNNNTIKGNNTGGSASPVDLTATQATAILNVMVGDSGAGGTKGLVPAPASGDAAEGKFLKADATWAVPSGGGGDTVLFKPDDQDITSNTTLQNDDDLKITLSANSQYSFRLVIRIVVGSATPDIKVAMNGPSSPVVFWYGIQVYQATYDAYASFSKLVTSYDDPVQPNWGTAADTLMIIDGYIETGSDVSQQLILRWCQRSSSATPTTVAQGSTMLVRELS